MSQTDTKYWELFISRQSGTISESDSAELEQWKIQNPDEYMVLEKIYMQSEDLYENREFDPVANWHELKAALDVEEGSQQTMTRIFPWIARIAAAILIILSVVYIFTDNRNNSGNNLVLQTVEQTDETSTKQIVLPDQSVVWLNRGSELLYPEQFTGDSRTVYLRGEAFFEVQPNARQPFIVMAGNSKTTVIGTSFNLRAYGKEDEIRLTVVSGNVAFTLLDGREGVTVTPGNMASMDNQSKQITNGINSDVNFLSWKTHELLFNNQPVNVLITDLIRHYGVEIRTDNPEIHTCRFTGDFRDTSLEDALRIITQSMGTSYKIEKGVCTITGSGCK